ncbi:Arl2 [Monocercomonoides exilis]|uniref:Arl2 n=1 Tax=Monocercomonoides exilis TaxID=2049356 RepID=UPI00355A04DB|nr:Arl2 [Monocercomonoides exilis]|eukprot:MONOS_10480.1-p1 / transcript=MONOS_10480.1 / gene=MONOS_10480 / organism=Monocercomonoides_exilis_PA203 / gene_product=Arl2 / transcript_product=Arl2 / location=Mono_scaffold00478:31611-32303(+) / protein_length=186 / sequence_SO=supercontig / SO=protein_coding / is_pseudo=false
MGLLSFLRKLKLKEREMRILLIGLDGAGKTTIMKKLKKEDTSKVSPTRGFKIETFMFDKIKMNIWDIGGQSFIRPYWRNYFEKTEGIIWVIDSTDPSRFFEGITELSKVLKAEKLAGASLLLLANKQDIHGAMTSEQIIKEMNLTEIVKGRSWHIEATSAMTGEGISEGFAWIARDVCSRIYTFT